MLGGGFFGSGAKKTTTNQTTNNQVDETGVQVSGDESIGVGKADSVHITDGGAFADAIDFARGALELPGAAMDAVADVSAESLKRGFEFGESLFGDSLDFASDESERYTDFARGIVNVSLEKVSDAVERSQEQLGDTVTALNAIAREQSMSTDERVQTLAKYVVLGVVALGIAYTLSRG